MSRHWCGPRSAATTPRHCQLCGLHGSLCPDPANIELCCQQSPLGDSAYFCSQPLYHQANWQPGTGDDIAARRSSSLACNSKHDGRSRLPGATLRTHPSMSIPWRFPEMVFTLVNPAWESSNMVPTLMILASRVSTGRLCGPSI
jgi:hypothetical protein